MRQMILLVALGACAEEMDLDRAGPPAPLELAVSAIAGGAQARMTARTVPPNQRVTFVFSTTGPGQTCPAALPGCVDLANARLLGSARGNRDGYAEAQVPVPANLPDGVRVWVQALSVAPNGSLIKSTPFERVTGGVMCPRIYMPVCGIDGQTYSNDCELGAAGTFLEYAGMC